MTLTVASLPWSFPVEFGPTSDSLLVREIVCHEVTGFIEGSCSTTANFFNKLFKARLAKVCYCVDCSKNTLLFSHYSRYLLPSVLQSVFPHRWFLLKASLVRLKSSSLVCEHHDILSVRHSILFKHSSLCFNSSSASIVSYRFYSNQKFLLLVDN